MASRVSTSAGYRPRRPGWAGAFVLAVAGAFVLAVAGAEADQGMLMAPVAKRGRGVSGGR
jgi:hypothetical protein